MVAEGSEGECLQGVHINIHTYYSVTNTDTTICIRSRTIFTYLGFSSVLFLHLEEQRGK